MQSSFVSSCEDEQEEFLLFQDQNKENKEKESWMGCLRKEKGGGQEESE